MIDKTIIGLFHHFKGRVTDSKDDKKIAVNLMLEGWEQVKSVKFRDEMDKIGRASCRERV